MKEKILGLMIASAGLFAIACTRNVEFATPATEGDEVTVTFSLSAEGGMASSSRAGDWKISDGKQIDKLVYAVYTKDAAEQSGYYLLEQYGNGAVGAGYGQAVVSTDDKLLSEKGYELTLRLMRGREYVIGFWAQNSNCTAYKTIDLQAVVVDYTNGNDALASNNDESRDAFCQVYTFTAQADVTEKVILKRALAQINVGTAGWDYNGEVDYGYNYAYSKIVMKGLYDQLNVLTGEVSKTDAVKDDEGNDKEIAYTWAPLPAYIHKTWTTDYPGDGNEGCKTWLKKIENNTEYLWVKLTTALPTDDTKDKYFWGNYLKYIEELTDDSYNVDGITTEVFKYLSMCYVLAPTYDPEDKNIPAKGGTTIDEVTFYLSETADGKVYLSNPDVNSTEKYVKEDAPKRFTIPNVPIQRNWRTNILGGTRGKETTLFDPRTYYLWVDLSPGFNGEHDYVGNIKDGKDKDGKDTDHEYEEPEE